MRSIAFDALHLGCSVQVIMHGQLIALVESIRQHGYRNYSPLVVGKRGKDRYLVLCGNKRVEALQWLQENDPAAFKCALPTGNVLCIVIN